MTSTLFDSQAPVSGAAGSKLPGSMAARLRVAESAVASSDVVPFGFTLAASASPPANPHVTSATSSVGIGTDGPEVATAVHRRASGTTAATVAAGLVESILNAQADVRGAEMPPVLSEGESRRVLRELRSLASMVAAKELAVIRAADRGRVADGSGASGTSAWVASTTRVTGAEAAGQVRLANALDAGLPETNAALESGLVSVEAASVIADTEARLPEGLDEKQRAKVEHRLVERAQELDPAKLRREATKIIREVEASVADEYADTEVRDREAAALAKTTFSMHANSDGTVSGHFTVPALAGAMLKKTIQALASPRRDRVTAAHIKGLRTMGAKRTGATSADRAGGLGNGHVGGVGNHPGGMTAAQMQRKLREARQHAEGLALLEILEHLDVDRLPGKMAATVVVTMDVNTLKANVGVGTSDVGVEVSASQVRRMACQAGIVPAVLDGESLPLDLGRTKRFFTENQRVALATAYEECAEEDCDRPFAWCELHHLTAWSKNGPTDLKDAVPLCGWHHRRIHDPGYTHRVKRAGPRKSVQFRQRT